MIYENAQVTFGGVAIDTVYNLPRSRPPETFAVTTTCLAGEGADRFFAAVQRIIPARPDSVMTLAMPWGILGTIKVSAVVQGVTHRGGADVQNTTTMEGAVDERELRREIASAVQRAIVDRCERNGVARRAAFGDGGDKVRRMGSKVLAGTGRRYRCERKQRKAIRRLLRAAGITRPAP